MEYESTILKRLINTYGVVGNPRYISEIIKEFIVQGKECFPNLFTYQADWLAHIDEFGLNPTYTVTYTGQSIYAPNTLERPVKSAILKGQTLLNMCSDGNIKKEIGWSGETQAKYNLNKDMINIDKEYLLIATVTNSTQPFYISFNRGNENGITYLTPKQNGLLKAKINFKNVGTIYPYFIIFHLNSSNKNSDGCIENVMLIEYQDGMENWDIPYFEGMQSVKMPVLTTNGKNLLNTNIFGCKQSDGTLKPAYTPNAGTLGNIVLKPNTKYVLSVTYNNSNTSNSQMYFPRIRTNNGNYILSRVIGTSTTNYSMVFTTTDEINYVIDLSSNNGDTKGLYIITSIQIEEGSTVTPYEPYQSNILTVNEDVTLRSNGSVCDELDLLTGKLTQRIDEDGEVLTQEVVKTVELTTLDQNGQNVEQLMTFNGGTHFNTGSLVGSPLPTVSVSVETDLEETLMMCSLEGYTM